MFTRPTLARDPIGGGAGAGGGGGAHRQRSCRVTSRIDDSSTIQSEAARFVGWSSVWASGSRRATSEARWGSSERASNLVRVWRAFSCGGCGRGA